ncbi:restriction endonuclease type II-like protein [Rhizophagus diaphanus]|nr:restriction endonuclease type II-like protein [Rhizophagus diaphanus] [Rhizophagus sp. MUCL 43196]
MPEVASEKLASILSELASILPSQYDLDRDKLEITLVDSEPATIENFKELATILPSQYKLDLADGKITIMPVHIQTSQKEARLISRVTIWCDNNPRLVGIFGSSQACFTLPLPTETVRGPGAFVILANSWNALSPNDQNEAFPPIVPDFVAEIRSNSNTVDFCHQKMLMYMDAGAQEGFLIDPINQTVTIYRINGNNIVWNERRNPRTVTSQILNGFVLNMQGII